MPLVDTVDLQDSCRVFVWHITEPIETLEYGITLSKSSQLRLKGFALESRKIAFLSVQRLIRVAGYSTKQLYYDANGKPHLDGVYISASHTADYAVLAIGDRPVGVDIEYQREQVSKIQAKFVGSPERNWAKGIALLTQLWCLKEATYKLLGCPGLSLRQDIEIMREEQYFRIEVKQQRLLQGNCFEINGFTCATVTEG